MNRKLRSSFVPGDGVVPPEKQEDARRAALNCAEHAVSLTERA